MEESRRMSDSTLDPWSLAAIEQNRRWLTSFLLAATGDRAAAEDLVQEAFRIAYEKRHTFVAGTNFGGWLRVIAQNCLGRHFERTRRQPVFLGAAMRRLEEAAAGAEERMLGPGSLRSRLEALRECMSRLTARAREILSRRYGQSRNAQEVASHLGMSVSAVNVAAFRAREALAECVQRKLSYDTRG